MSAIDARTRVHISTELNNVRYYLTKVETARRKDTKQLYIKGFWSDDAQKSQPFTYETAALIRRRLKEESCVETRIAFTAGNTAELIDEA